VFSLYSRISVLFTAILIGLGATIWYIAHQSQVRYFEEATQQLNKPVAMYIANQIPLFINGKFDDKALTELASHMMIVNPSLELYLLDTEGRVMASAADATSGYVKNMTVDMEPVNQFLSESSQFPIYGDDPKSTGEKRVFSVFPLSDIGIGASSCNPCGYVYAVLGGERVGSPWAVLGSSQTLQFSTWMIVAVLISALFAGLCLFFMLTRPLRAMTDSIAQWQIVASGFTVRSGQAVVSSHHGNELEALQTTCQNMAQRLQRQYIELDAADQRRRKLYTHLSHDLRTPLTGVCGALETLTEKSDCMTASERDGCFNVAYRQARRLDRLIDQVFELARLDSGDVLLELELVSFQELAMDTVQELATEAACKGIALRFIPCTEDQNPLVRADLGQLDRVLVNLLSNAIRHTPVGGLITVQTKMETDQTLEVIISDSGCGFAERIDQQPLSTIDLISHANEGVASSGTGLGLSIVSRILMLHGSEAVLDSKPGHGSQITFHLPIVEG